MATAQPYSLPRFLMDFKFSNLKNLSPKKKGIVLGTLVGLVIVFFFFNNTGEPPKLTVGLFVSASHRLEPYQAYSRSTLDPKYQALFLIYT